MSIIYIGKFIVMLKKCPGHLHISLKIDDYYGD